MMDKCIVAVEGHKNIFQKTVEDNYVTRIADCDQMLQTVLEVLGWDGVKNQDYYDFYNELFRLSNKAFDFKNKYISRAIDEFRGDDSSQVLIIKGSNELVEYLEDDAGIFSVFIAKNKEEVNGNSEKYDKVITLDNSFEDSVKTTLDILLNKEIEKI
jgi:hypothetical protein